jgi:hypothetical protein
VSALQGTPSGPTGTFPAQGQHNASPDVNIRLNSSVQFAVWQLSKYKTSFTKPFFQQYALYNGFGKYVYFIKTFYILRIVGAIYRFKKLDIKAGCKQQCEIPKNNQHYALNCTTPLFNIQAVTCFGSSLPSSGSLLV